MWAENRGLWGLETSRVSHRCLAVWHWTRHSTSLSLGERRKSTPRVLGAQGKAGGAAVTSWQHTMGSSCRAAQEARRPPRG